MILFATRQKIEQLINSSAKPFENILNNWDPSAPVGIFWRVGNDDGFLVDHVTTRGLKSISCENLLDIWNKWCVAGEQSGVRVARRRIWRSTYFSCLFC